MDVLVERRTSRKTYVLRGCQPALRAAHRASPSRRALPIGGFELASQN